MAKKAKPIEITAADVPQPSPKVQTLSATQIGTLFGRTERWVSTLIHDQFIKKNEEGKVTIVAACRGILAYFEDRIERASKSAAAKRATEARAREIEMRIDERERNLIPLDDALGIVAEVAAIARSEITGFPASYTRDMVERRKLEAAIDKILKRMAEKARTAGEELRTGRSDLGTVS